MRRRRRDGAGVAKPVRLPSERGEIRVPLGIDVSVGIEQTVQGQLVEDDEHDWRSPFDRLHRRRRFRRQKRLFHARIEEKQCRNDERGGRKRREELPNDSASSVRRPPRRRPTRALIRASQGDDEHFAPPKPRHHDGCRQERQHDADETSRPRAG